MITIHMLKTCGKSICRALELVFNERISNRVFASEWKKGNVVPIHKKNNTMFGKLPLSLISTNLWQNL